MPKLINQPTTAQSLGSLIKSARDIMRKDKGLNGDLDRLPMLTWIMFLKFLDDLELQREGEAKLSWKKCTRRECSGSKIFETPIIFSTFSIPSSVAFTDRNFSSTM